MSTRSRGRGREDSHTQGRELREGERTPGAHLGAHEVYDGVEALAGARGRSDGALALVGGADREDRVKSGEFARAAQVGGDGGELLAQARDAVPGALGCAVP